MLAFTPMAFAPLAFVPLAFVLLALVSLALVPLAFVLLAVVPLVVVKLALVPLELSPLQNPGTCTSAAASNATSDGIMQPAINGRVLVKCPKERAGEFVGQRCGGVDSWYLTWKVPYTLSMDETRPHSRLPVSDVKQKPTSSTLLCVALHRCPGSSTALLQCRIHWHVERPTLCVLPMCSPICSVPRIDMEWPLEADPTGWIVSRYTSVPAAESTATARSVRVIVRRPQSKQSVPMVHSANSAPGPPSSQWESEANSHESKQAEFASPQRPVSLGGSAMVGCTKNGALSVSGLDA